jgi:hypothetical protein
MDALDLGRWLIAVPLGICGAWVTLCNYACIALGLFRGKHHSMVPLLGGAFSALALLLCPAVHRWSWAWVPLAVDPGCLLLFVLGGPFLIRECVRAGKADSGPGN